MIPNKSHNIPIYIKICIFYYVHVAYALRKSDVPRVQKRALDPWGWSCRLL